MPTYEYQCEACGHRFEKFQSIKAAPIRKCPACAKTKVKRLLGTGAGIIFKGSGFYITDYRDSSYKEKAKAESGSAGATTDAAKPSDAKPEAKTETKPPAAAKPAVAASETKPKKKPAK
jgi:putative FmdB family regulatory protein